MVMGYITKIHWHQILLIQMKKRPIGGGERERERERGEEPPFVSSLERKEWCKHLITHPYYYNILFSITPYLLQKHTQTHTHSLSLSLSLLLLLLLLLVSVFWSSFCCYSFLWVLLLLLLLLFCVSVFLL